MAHLFIGLDIVGHAQRLHVFCQTITMVTIDHVRATPATDCRANAGHIFHVFRDTAIERCHDLHRCLAGVEHRKTPAHAEAHDTHLGHRLLALIEQPFPAGFQLLEGLPLAGLMGLQGFHHTQGLAAGQIIEVRHQYRITVIRQPLGNALDILGIAEDVMDGDHRRLMGISGFGAQPTGTHGMAARDGNAYRLVGHGKTNE